MSLRVLTVRRIAWGALAAALFFAVVYGLVFRTLVADAYHGRSFDLLNRILGHADEHPLVFYLLKADMLAMFAFAGLLTASVVFSRAAGPLDERSMKLCDAAMWALFASLFYFHLVFAGDQQAWYLFRDVHDLTVVPPFRHRLMFVWPAMGLQKLFPSLSLVQTFFASQALAIALALWAVKRWAGLFVDKKFAFAAQFMTVAMWAPTLTYYTFYDIGIIFVYAFCLYHLMRREWVPYLAVFTLGTVNHEITLFLVVVSACVLYPQMSKKRLAAVLAMQLAFYALARAIMFSALPVERAWVPGKPAENIQLILNHPGVVMRNMLPIAIWFGLSMLCMRDAPGRLKRCWVLMPCLIAMTFMVGQYNEGRQFDAFIPVAAALMLCGIESRTRWSENPRSGGTHDARAS